jgi:hypothetical protein
MGCGCFDAQVRGVEFNQHSKNLLATGGVDGELCIWDIVNPSAPTLYPALKVCLISCPHGTIFILLSRYGWYPALVAPFLSCPQGTGRTLAFKQKLWRACKVWLVLSGWYGWYLEFSA